ncbi:tRNA (adenosine(37)-N6)-threonylcarbamoyltransferase complex transferase subunit TsaD [bacterium]|nr:MAG: tRNA (adenosine(37)-N6)-threonylcarbamoyltransferase complex transferase subunit TsaD [bacterium]
MLILGIETSCDDTAAGVVEDGALVRSSVVLSQDGIHSKYGGIVPELASRQHIEAIAPVVEEALAKASVTLDCVDGISVTEGPGLVGSLLVGMSFAKAISFAKGIPLTAVNHIEAHSVAAFLTEPGLAVKPPKFPFVSLVVSGGHTTLFLVNDYTAHEVIGETLDDAAGEAFDKAAKLLGLGYPGGAMIDALAKNGNPAYVEFTRPYLAKDSLDFSFSGIKTAVLNRVRGFNGAISDDVLKDLSASFQEAIVDVLVTKAMRAVKKTGVSHLVAAGGVACNSRLRRKLTEEASAYGVSLCIPPPRFCSDNAAMVAGMGFYKMQKGVFAGLDLNANPNMPR